MSICTSNLTSGFIDLATYDELEKYMYGGPDATAYFVRETRKATWFTQVPTVLSRASGTPDYGQTWSVSISRAGDYLLNTWLRVLVPQITNSGAPGVSVDNAPTASQIGWCQNLAHNLVSECCITFNDLVAARFDSLHLDFWSAFTVPASKQVGYNNMIGNVAAMTQPNTYPASVQQALGGNLFTGSGLNQQTIGPNGGFFLNLPLPFFYARDSGVALPTAALPYNDMRITFTFRPLATLLTRYQNAGVATGAPAIGAAANASASTISTPALSQQCQGVSLQTVQVWAEYAIVSNDERKRMACAPRDILIEQVQSAPLQTFVPQQNNSPNYDIRFSHAIKVLFFAMVNNTNQHAARSCYGTDCPSTGNIAAGLANVTFSSNNNVDPILNTSLIYENTARLATMGSDYYSLVDPYYHGPVIPAIVGLHMYSYSLDFICLDPLGSTNYGKLTNVSMVPVGAARAAAVAQAGNIAAVGAGTTAQILGLITQSAVGGIGAVFLNNNQTWSFVVTAVNNNIIRISGGALGFPVL